MSRRRVLPFMPLITLVLLLGPVLAGLWGTILPAFGHLPAAGLRGFGLDPLATVFATPGIGRSIWLSVTTGLLSASVSLGLVVLIVAGWSGTRPFQALERVLSPFLAVPHAAAAFGLAFMIAPSGWIARLLSPWATGWVRPPDWLILQDPWGFAMLTGLVLKETPFLLLMTLAALGQADGPRSLGVAGALGYGRVSGWTKAVFPRVYAQIRLPVYVVLAYSMSVVEVAIILGPSTPAPLSVLIVRWMGDPDLALRLRAAAAALVQFGLVLGVLALWRGAEVVLGSLGKRWVWLGSRGRLDGLGRALGLIAGGAIALLVTGGLVVLGLWSVAGFWTFPAALPDALTWANWIRHGDGILGALGQTAIVAGVATALSLVFVIGCLEAEYRYGLRIGNRGLWLLYLPLLIPQTAFLPGLQTLMLDFGANTGLAAVILVHVVFVLPYLFLSLGDAFRAWNPRMGVIACALGASPDRVLWTVRLPMLLRPVLTAAAVGLAVSVGQYLPTLLIGGGRVATLTTEAVALASGGDRRAIAVYGLMQTGAALVPFAAALFLPALVWRNRKGLRHG